MDPREVLMLPGRAISRLFDLNKIDPGPFGGPGHATVDWHGRSTDQPGQAEGQAGLAATAHSEALAPHKDEATEADTPNGSNYGTPTMTRTDE